MESIGTYWIPIKPNLVPFLEKEIDKVIEKFFNLTKLSERGNEDALRKLELLKISIKARIEDYDASYKKHFQDNRVAFFEKQKFRLRKLLHESKNFEELSNGELGMKYYDASKIHRSKKKVFKGMSKKNTKRGVFA